MSTEKLFVTVTRKYFSTRCSNLAWENYRTAQEASRQLDALRADGLVGHRVAHLYDDEDLARQFIWDRAALHKATSGAMPLLWVSVSYRQDLFDPALLDPIVERFELKLFQEFDDSDGRKT